MSAFTTPRKSLRLRKNEPSPFLTNRKRELFPVDNWDEDSHDIIPLQSSPEVYDPGLDSPESSINMNCTPITELSPSMSDKFERLMSGSKNGHECSATIVIEETPNSRRIKNVNTTPFESETNKAAKTPSKKSFGLNNKTALGVKTITFYGSNQISLEDLRVKRFTRLNYNPKVKAKLFKDTKSTSKKRPRSTSQEQKSKIILFPGVTLPFKKKSSVKKPFIKTELCDEKDDLIENNEVIKKNNFDFSKPSSSSKNVWTQYIKQEKPERIKIEDSDNRKFFKSKVIHNDTSNRKDNSFNFKVVNWGDENRMSTVDQSDFNNTEVLDDGALEQIGQEVNELIELLDDEDDDDDSTAVRYPGLATNSTKRNHEDQDDEDSYMELDPKRLKSDVQSHNHIILRSQMPDLIRDAYASDENYYSAYSSQKDVSNTFELNNMVLDEPIDTSNNASVVINESPQTKFFPIFTNQTPSPSHITCEKPTARRIKRIIDATQYQIDAGQKKFGGFLCKQCGLYYSRGEPEDEAEHDKYHVAKNIFKYNSFKNEKVLYQDTNERIVVISGSDPKIACTKALEVISFVDVELGFNTQTSVLPTTKKVYLYIKDKQVIGCLVVELISEAYRNLETETEDMVIVSEESYPVKVGVNRIWTKWDCRKKGIASKLLDCFRKTYAYGHILTLDEIAFTVPTRAGKQFIKKYTNKNDYLVYTGW
ncbi:PREDICTED: N-acetyltransferase ESCO2-like [Diuraphis noxia]|uniref:N-acetyltransferase ESCO2-like n=1 Tax=Diuraphis noxia TaxID=143948 RepID=UPI0007637F06|nr:PREDICTED: N-acetyltransferase ESCO2-like [Diuraphis noxia]XP_015373118.1 PREDICTED: N-acetyltransferase ESCO2-like [Diuraphis noxia]